MNFLGSAEKNLITEDSFVVYFDYGGNKQGYWKYDTFVLQCEDIIDRIDFLYPDFQVIMSVENSFVHDRQRYNSLNTTEIHVSWGGMYEWI